MKKVNKICLFPYLTDGSTINLNLRKGAVIVSCHLEQSGTQPGASRSIHLCLLEDDTQPSVSRQFKLFAVNQGYSTPAFDCGQRYWHIGTVQAMESSAYNIYHYWTVWEFK